MTEDELKPDAIEEVSSDDFFSPPPQRHGCLTAWLILMLIANSALALIYLVTAQRLMNVMKISMISIIMLVILGVANTIFAIALLYWKKIGFYGFAVTTAIAFAINIGIGISPSRCIIGLAGILILYGVFQIKSEGVSGWDNLI